MEKLSPKAQGNLGEAAALKELLKHDLIVCPPYGDNAPYDYMDITNKMAHYLLIAKPRILKIRDPTMGVKVRVLYAPPSGAIAQ